MSNNENYDTPLHQEENHSYSGKAFDKFVQESEEYINSLTDENNSLKKQLAEEVRLREAAKDAAGQSVTLLSTAEKVAKEYREDSQAKADEVLKEAHEYSQNVYNDADTYNVETRAEADAYHANIVATAKDDLAVITEKVNAKIVTYKEVTERLAAFHTASLAALVEPQEDVALLEDEIEVVPAAHNLDEALREEPHEILVGDISEVSIINTLSDVNDNKDIDASQALGTEEIDSNEEIKALETEDSDTDEEVDVNDAGLDVEALGTEDVDSDEEVSELDSDEDTANEDTGLDTNDEESELDFSNVNGSE